LGNECISVKGMLEIYACAEVIIIIQKLERMYLQDIIIIITG